MCGSTTQSTATAATAASAALPPARKVSMAASVASGWEVAAMPWQAITGERPGSWKSRLISYQSLLSGRGGGGAFGRGRGVIGGGRDWRCGGRRLGRQGGFSDLGRGLNMLQHRVAAARAEGEQEAAEQVEEAHDKDEEERRARRLPHQNEFRRDAEKQQYREAVIDPAACIAGRLHHFDEQQRDGQRDQ